MSHVPHELHDEFPAEAELIHKLKLENAHFANLATQYHEVNRQIHRIETEVEPASDMTLTDLRKQRLHLEDEISAMLSAAKAA